MHPQKILMCEPEYFEVNYPGNHFMKNNLSNTDKNAAMSQWIKLKETYNELGFDVELINPVHSLPDMVFTANQSLPYLDKEENKCVILSKMKNPQRMDEVKYFEEYYRGAGYIINRLPDDVKYFESMGDCVVDYERNILFGGYGYRTDVKTYDSIAKLTNFKVIKLQLLNPILYHLDTCFSILNTETAIIAASAFDAAGLAEIKSQFSNIIIADEDENLRYFVCNCHCPDGKNVIVQKGSRKFKNDIKKAGLNLIEIETGEFIKSGGSVFCMKLMIY